MTAGQVRRLAGVLCAAVLLTSCGVGNFGRDVGPATSSDERIGTLRSQLARNPENVKALTGIGREYAKQGRWQQSAGAYREALIVNPNDRDALLGFSAAQSALGQYDVALDHADRALAARKDVPALVLRGVALSGQRRTAEAKVAFDTAFSISPRDLDVRNNLALTLALGGDQQAYAIMRAVAFAPEADLRHRRNFYLVAGILGQEAAARQEGAALGVGEAEVEEIFKIARRARSEGMVAFGLAGLL